MQAWLNDAVAAGAVPICGGGRDGSVLTPTLLDGVAPGMRAYDDELFGPACGLRAFDSEDGRPSRWRTKPATG